MDKKELIDKALLPETEGEPLSLPGMADEPSSEEFSFFCPHCGQHLKTKMGMAAMAIECPACHGALEIPAQTPVGAEKVADGVCARVTDRDSGQDPTEHQGRLDTGAKKGRRRRFFVAFAAGVVTCLVLVALIAPVVYRIKLVMALRPFVTSMTNTVAHAYDGFVLSRVVRVNTDRPLLIIGVASVVDKVGFSVTSEAGGGGWIQAVTVDVVSADSQRVLYSERLYATKSGAAASFEMTLRKSVQEVVRLVIREQ